MSIPNTDHGVTAAGIAVPAGSRAGLRRAGLAALVALIGMVVTPAFVIISSLFSDVDYSDPLIKQDPLSAMNQPVMGAVFGIQGLVVAAALAVMVVSLRQYLVQSMASELMALAGVVPVICWAVYGGAAALSYSSILQGDITTVQTDPAIRAMVGYAQMDTTQGLMGSAGVALMVSALFLHHGAGERGMSGRLFLTTSWILTVLAVVAYILGIGGFATVLAMPMMLLLTVTLLWRSRT